jgi:hypothetical protein
MGEIALQRGKTAVERTEKPFNRAKSAIVTGFLPLQRRESGVESADAAIWRGKKPGDRVFSALSIGVEKVFRWLTTL